MIRRGRGGGAEQRGWMTPISRREDGEEAALVHGV